MSLPREKPVQSHLYTEDYYLQNCGGAEFFKRYGPRIVKPSSAYALKRAGLRSGMLALDIGCGRGEILYQLREKKVVAIGGDFAPAALRLAAEASKAPVLRCDAKSLPFKDAVFDRVFFLGVMDHLHDWELEACFGEFKRVLKPGGRVLADTCTNTQYYKSLTYGLRKAASAALGLKPPTPPRSGEDQALHINEHCESVLAAFFARIGWGGELTLRPNEKYLVPDLYEKPLPADFPLKTPPPWKLAWNRAMFRGPWKRFLGREIFCDMSPL